MQYPAIQLDNVHAGSRSNHVRGTLKRPKALVLQVSSSVNPSITTCIILPLRYRFSERALIRAASFLPSTWLAEDIVCVFCDDNQYAVGRGIKHTH